MGYALTTAWHDADGPAAAATAAAAAPSGDSSAPPADVEEGALGTGSDTAGMASVTVARKCSRDGS